ncbi:VOC family protein [Halocola ammonii]
MELSKLTLLCQSVSDQKSFYENILGLQTSTPNDKTLIVQCGNSELVFEELKGEFTPYHFAFNIPENLHEQALEWLSGKVDLFDYKGDRVVHFANWDAHAIYFTDADGNILEFIARHTLSNASEEPFHPRLITELSEIGAPTDRLPELRKELKELTGLSEYSDFSDSFTAVGDAHGLIILVPTDRNWMPTEIPSKPAPFNLEINSGQQKQTIQFDGHKFAETN